MIQTQPIQASHDAVQIPGADLHDQECDIKAHTEVRNSLR